MAPPVHPIISRLPVRLSPETRPLIAPPMPHPRAWKTPRTSLPDCVSVAVASPAPPQTVGPTDKKRPLQVPERSTEAATELGPVTSLESLQAPARRETAAATENTRTR